MSLRRQLVENPGKTFVAFCGFGVGLFVLGTYIFGSTEFTDLMKSFDKNGLQIFYSVPGVVAFFGIFGLGFLASVFLLGFEITKTALVEVALDVPAKKTRSQIQVNEK